MNTDSNSNKINTDQNSNKINTDSNRDIFINQTLVLLYSHYLTITDWLIKLNSTHENFEWQIQIKYKINKEQSLVCSMLGIEYEY